MKRSSGGFGGKNRKREKKLKRGKKRRGAGRQEDPQSNHSLLENIMTF